MKNVGTFPIELKAFEKCSFSVQVYSLKTQSEIFSVFKSTFGSLGLKAGLSTLLASSGIHSLAIEVEVIKPVQSFTF